VAYVSLYRKYRSQRFAELIGQEHITTVLQNSIRSGRIPHAYLFCGPRGCGKTSTARLLARALNCQSFDAPTPDPCGKCTACERIRDGNSIDVVEMDAASETGIDDVREKIIENARYAPVECRYKVYIIDEVHDLSQKAFDSLLKTIEEPPAHVVFVLATTEAHKVPMTIRSRCQRLDFRRGATADLSANLKRVLEAEKREYEPEALFLLSRAAEGSFRDSLSLLEQVMAYTDGPITAEAVHHAVGAVTTDLLDAVISAVAADDLKAVFQAGQSLIASGADTRQVLTSLQAQVRDLMVVAYAGSGAALEGMPQERIAVLQEQSRHFTPQQLVAMLGVLSEAERDVRFTNQHRLVLERALWRMMPGALNVAGARPAPPVRPSPVPQKASAPPMRTSVPDTSPTPPAPQTAPAIQNPPALRKEHPPAADTPQQPEFATEVDLDVLRRIWPRVRQHILQRSRAAAAIFGSEEVVSLNGTTVTVAFPTEFARGRADRPQAREMLEDVLAEELRIKGYTVRCVLAGASAGSAAGAEGSTDTKDDASPLLQQVLLEFPNAKPADEGA
jgi:DNA polymerase-3 subunit gamma/tau